MKKSSKLKSIDSGKKLLRYSSIAAALLAVASPESQAQIVYTDVDPDESISAGGSISIDMDNSSSVEIMIGQSSFTSTTDGTLYRFASNYMNMAPGVGIEGGSVTASAWSTTLNLARAKSAGDLIGSSAAFASSGGPRLKGGVIKSWQRPSSTTVTQYGSLPNTGPKNFIGIKFEIAGEIHYGWARVTFSSDCDSVTLHDYAYEATPNTPIIAGDTGTTTGIVQSDLISSRVQLYSFGRKLNYKDDFSANSQSKIVLSDLSGRELASFNANGSTSYAFDLPEFTSGLYIVTVQRPEGSFSKKVHLD